MFVQQTVPPVGMFTVGGSKKLSPISTSVEPAGQVGGPPTTSFSTLASEVVHVGAPARSDHRVADSHARRERARCDQRSAPATRCSSATSYLETSFSPSKVGQHSCRRSHTAAPATTARPAVFFAIGMSSQLVGGRPRVRCDVVAPGVAEHLIGVRASTRHVQLAVDHPRGGSALARGRRARCLDGPRVRDRVVLPGLVRDAVDRRTSRSRRSGRSSRWPGCSRRPSGCAGRAWARPSSRCWSRCRRSGSRRRR